MSDLTDRLRDGKTVPLMEERRKAADEIDKLRVQCKMLMDDKAALMARVAVLEGALEGALKWGAALSPDEHAKCRAALKRED